MNATPHAPKADRLADDDAARNFAASEPAGAAGLSEEAAGSIPARQPSPAPPS